MRKLKLDITTKPYKRGKPIAVQLDYIATFTCENLNELEVQFTEMKCNNRKESENNVELEEYMSILTFGMVMVTANAPKKITKYLTIEAILFNYLKYNIPKLVKQFQKRKTHNCVHNWINFQCCSFLTEWEKIGTEKIQEKYSN
jgi:hypothetical protein